MDLNPILFPQVTNRESWSQIVGLYDVDTGDALDLDGMTFACEVRRTGLGCNSYGSSGYGIAGDIGGVSDYGPVLTLALGDGLTVIDTGQLQIAMTLDQMRTLTPDTYSFALTATSEDGDDTRQVFLGQLPVLFGGVS